MSKLNPPRLIANFSGKILECGCDEAGRGCLAGPVVAAAVILPEGFNCPGLTDSEQLSENMRNKLRPIIEKEALAWNVALADANEIDEINILNASILAMHRAIDNLELRPEYIIVDGNRFRKYGEIPHHTIVKGDSRYLSIAAASVLAKTYRDEIMCKLHEEFAGYGWKKNKGYPTVAHRKAITKYGPSPFHRMSFRLLKEPELPLDF